MNTVYCIAEDKMTHTDSYSKIVLYFELNFNDNGSVTTERKVWN